VCVGYRPIDQQLKKHRLMSSANENYARIDAKILRRCGSAINFIPAGLNDGTKPSRLSCDDRLCSLRCEVVGRHDHAQSNQNFDRRRMSQNWTSALDTDTLIVAEGLSWSAFDGSVQSSLINQGMFCTAVGDGVSIAIVWLVLRPGMPRSVVLL
jgi:hypothetical protein